MQLVHVFQLDVYVFQLLHRFQVVHVFQLVRPFVTNLLTLTGDFAISNGARLGNRTEAVLLVLPSDDPFGVLEFATNSLEVSVAEDYLPGKINVTYANLTVQRTKGSFGSLQVCLLIMIYTPGVTKQFYTWVLEGSWLCASIKIYVPIVQEKTPYVGVS